MTRLDFRPDVETAPLGDLPRGFHLIGVPAKEPVLLRFLDVPQRAERYRAGVQSCGHQMAIERRFDAEAGVFELGDALQDAPSEHPLAAQDRKECLDEVARDLPDRDVRVAHQDGKQQIVDVFGRESNEVSVKPQNEFGAGHGEARGDRTAFPLVFGERDDAGTLPSVRAGRREVRLV
jgi:hypothetical protein